VTNNDVEASVVSHLKARGLVASVTDDILHIESQISKEPTSIYCGADPSAASLHVGNLIPLIVLLHFYIRGHNPVVLVGGATGQVGDPSGRTTERDQMEEDTRKANVSKIHGQMIQFLERGWQYAQTRGYTHRGTAVRANNLDWWKDMGMLHFLGTYGRHIRISQMLARDSVKSRLSSDQGIGFNEFTYQILQAYDFWHLYKTHNVRIQVGGNDQWGNITAGIDLISRLKNSLPKDAQKDAFGLTVPLLTTPSGEKFGKSAGNAIWLNSVMTKPYELFQYFIKAPDSVVGDYLKLFTLLPLDTIDEVTLTHQTTPEKRYAQRVLAHEVTDLVHGIGSGARTGLISSLLFPIQGDSVNHSSQDIMSAFEQEGLLVVEKRSEIVGQPWKSVLSKVLGRSKSEISRLLKGNGVYYGLEKKAVEEDIISPHHMIDNELLLCRTGKSNYTVIKVVE
jgi:tyrosyl-tRNA synthetase